VRVRFLYLGYAPPTSILPRGGGRRTDPYPRWGEEERHTPSPLAGEGGDGGEAAPHTKL